MRLLSILAIVLVAAVAATADAASTAVPSNTRMPSISGTARDGQLLTAHDGRWTGSPGSFSYAWERCDVQGGNCAAIPGANAKEYTLGTADAGSRIRVVVTATNGSGSGSATSRPTGTVAVSGSRPELHRLPSISGNAQPGSTLAVTDGGWSGTQPIRFDFSWQRCDSAVHNCSTFIAHSTASTYTLGSGDVGHRLRVEVTATNSRGTKSVFTAATGVVAAPVTTIAITQVSLPDRLVIDGVTFAPTPATSRTAPITARFHVSDTKGLSVQGALVYALGLPYGWTYNAPEQPTDSSGWATITIQPTRAMPLRRGTELVLFVRARKPGDNLLAGVSTRRLVQEGIR